IRAANREAYNRNSQFFGASPLTKNFPFNMSNNPFFIFFLYAFRDAEFCASCPGVARDFPGRGDDHPTHFFQGNTYVPVKILLGIPLEFSRADESFHQTVLQGMVGDQAQPSLWI